MLLVQYQKGLNCAGTSCQVLCVVGKLWLPVQVGTLLLLTKILGCIFISCLLKKVIYAEGHQKLCCHL